MQKFLKSLAESLNPNKKIDPDAVRYAGLNIRLLSNLFDMLVLLILTLPFLLIVQLPELGKLPQTTPVEVAAAFDAHNQHQITTEEFMNRITPYFLNEIVPRLMTYIFINLLVVGIIFILFWKYFNATPGKLVFGLRIADEKTLQPPTTSQYIIRYIGYIISALPVFLGFFIIPLSRRKRGLHDFIADTVVIYSQNTNPEWERKKNKFKLYFVLIFTIIAIIYISNKK